MSRLPAIALTAAILATGCATGPYNGQEISTGTIGFAGFGDSPNAKVRFEAYDWIAKKWWPTAETYTRPTAFFAAGAICPNSPALYYYTGSMYLNWPLYWDLQSGKYTARVRATQYTAANTTIMFADRPGAVDCVISNGFNQTCDFYNIAYNVCGFHLTTADVKTTSTAPWFEP